MSSLSHDVVVPEHTNSHQNGRAEIMCISANSIVLVCPRLRTCLYNNDNNNNHHNHHNHKEQQSRSRASGTKKSI